MTNSKIITFRATGTLLHDLQQLATSTGKSEGELAKGFTKKALTEDSSELTSNASELFEALRQDVLTLRRDLATVMEMLLLNVANVPEEQVKAFVSRNLRG